MFHLRASRREKSSRALRMTAGTRERRAFACALALVALAACVWASGGASSSSSASAQSGRRSPQPISPVPTPTPEATPEGESESVSRGRPPSEQSKALLTLAVYEEDSAYHYVTRDVSEMVMESFLARLSASPSVSAARGGARVSRKEAQRQAKSEKETYVLVLQLAEDVAPGRESIGRADTRQLAIKLSMYEPGTGALKYTDTIWQRPYRQTTSIGGMRIPLPTSRTRRIERFPNELELEQAAREAAYRTMMRFHINLPPDN